MKTQDSAYRREQWNAEVSSGWADEQDQRGWVNGFRFVLECESEEIARKYGEKLAAALDLPVQGVSIRHHVMEHRRLSGEPGTRTQNGSADPLRA